MARKGRVKGLILQLAQISEEYSYTGPVKLESALDPIVGI